MTEFNNPIEKYNEQDRKLFGFLRKAGSFLSYVYYAFHGTWIGAVAGTVMPLLGGGSIGGIKGIALSALGGCILGLIVYKIELLLEEKMNEWLGIRELPIIPFILLACLIYAWLLHFFV